MLLSVIIILFAEFGRGRIGESPEYRVKSLEIPVAYHQGDLINGHIRTDQKAHTLFDPGLLQVLYVGHANGFFELHTHVGQGIVKFPTDIL